MSVAVLKQYIKYKHRPASSSIGDRVTDLKSPSVNIVHVKRQLHLSKQQYEPLLRAIHQAPVRAILPTAREQLAAELSALLAAPASGDAATAAALVKDDILEAAQQLRDALGWQQLHLKLEAISRVTCPKWHADFVGVRLLCTYTGPGTMYVSDQHAQRRWDVLGGNVMVGPVQEAAALQAGPGDWLLLKGHLQPGNYGMGAVHRSPELRAAGEPRLLLTIDDDWEGPGGCCQR